MLKSDPKDWRTLQRQGVAVATTAGIQIHEQAKPIIAMPSLISPATLPGTTRDPCETQIVSVEKGERESQRAL